MSALEITPQPEKVRVMTISHAVDLYLGELARQGRTPRTLDSYRRVLNKLSDTYVHIDVEEVTSPMVRRFLDGFQFNAKAKTRVPNSPATTAQIASIIRSFFGWLREEDYIKRDPAERIKRPKLQSAHENDNVVSVSATDVRALLDAAVGWPERLAIHLAVYTGARRHALSSIRRRDYDPFAGTLRFEEKGGKVIEKPIAPKLAAILDSAIFAGVYESDDDYLIPSKMPQRREGIRDDRIVWSLILDVGKRAGVTTHVHALRAAFATHYLESMPENVIALQSLMGHARLETTLIYLRRLDRRQQMETVRALDWSESFEAKNATEKEGFEPSFQVENAAEGVGSPWEDDLRDVDLLGTLLGRARESEDMSATGRAD